MSYSDLCNEAGWQKRVDDLERQLSETRKAWQGCRQEYGALRVELAEARAVAISAVQTLRGVAGSPHTTAIADVLVRRYEWLRGGA